MLPDDVVRDVKASLYLLWGGVLFVLVIGCVNIANLVIVRASGRRARDGDAPRDRRRSRRGSRGSC